MSTILKDVRLTFPDLFEPVEFEPGDGKPRYNATFIIEPGTDAHKAAMAAYEAKAKEAFGTKAKSFLASIESNPQKNCFYKGDLKPEYEGYPGNMILSSHRKGKDGRPKLLRRDKSLIENDKGELYSGCYVNVSVDIWAQTKPEKHAGMRCSVLGVQFLRDGDSFAGAKKSDGSEFDTLEDAGDSDDL